MRYLVTGGAGYIGSTLVRALLAQGHEVEVWDDLSRGNLDAVPRGVPLLLPDEVTPYKALLGMDGVFHLAGHIDAAESVAVPERYYRNNLSAHVPLMVKAARVGVPVVFASTAAVYLPSEEPLTESSLIAPSNPYAKSKRAMEQVISTMMQGEAAYALCRFFNVAGSDGIDGERHFTETHLIPNILSNPSLTLYPSSKPTRDGSCIRDYIHVSDIADGLMRAMGYAQRKGSGVFNFGSGKGYTTLEVVVECVKVRGPIAYSIASEPREGDPPYLVASNERARRVLGWEPKHDLAAIIRSAAEFMDRVDSRGRRAVD